MNTRLPPLGVIAGPTASGKTALAIALAQRLNGVIVNADSAQVYADLPILSAQPSAAERGGVEHRLMGHRDGARPCSAAEWAAEARAEVAAVQAEGRLPILVGGTGLYLRTLLDGIADVPAVDPGIRAEVRAGEAAENYAALEARDPAAAARLHPNDRQRVARALEVVRSTGRTLADWQAAPAEGGIRGEVQLFGAIVGAASPPPTGRFAERLEAMVAAGALDEVRRLVARGLDPALPVMRAIGVRELAAHLSGETTLDEAIGAAVLATRQYAKRQRTWFRHQPLGVGQAATAGDEALAALEAAARAAGC